MKTVTRKFGTIVVALFVALGFSSAALASDVKTDTAAVAFNYVGKINNQPVFELNVPNTEKDEYIITIIDEFGATLYYNRVKGKSVNTKFMLNEELEANSLRVEVKAKRSDKAEVFQIVNKTRLVQEASVTKL